MEHRSKVSVDVLTTLLDKSSPKHMAKRTWFAISLGVSVGLLLTVLMGISLPAPVYMSMLLVAWTGHIISTIRYMNQKMSIMLVECETGEQLDLLFDKDQNQFLFGVKSGEGEIVYIPLYKKYRCVKGKEGDQVVYTVVGSPSKEFDWTCRYALTDKPLFCHKTRRVNLFYVVRDKVPPEIVSCLDDLSRKGRQRAKAPEVEKNTPVLPDTEATD